jgi:chemosensory pili system protein ChpA (sensor histidine kinase/response regulator)
MSLNNDFDVGPLTWVKGEIDSALNSARDRLLEVQADPGQREPLRFAQNHVHQASGALSIVGLDGVQQFAEGIDKLLSAMAANELQPSPELFGLALRSVGMLGNYINELSAGAPHQPLRLFDAYRDLVLARGGEAPQPSELFFPDLSVRPQLATTEAVAPERAAHELRVLRGRFEKGLLNWLRKPQDVSGPQEMLGAVYRIEQIQALPATRAFWWASIAFFEGLAVQAIVADRASQRICRRIDTQMRRLLEGSQIVAERLVRDVLYFVATARINSEHAQAVRSAYGLDEILPSPDVELSDTLRQPFILRVRETLEHAKETWNRYCAGSAVALPQFQEQMTELAKRAEPLKLAQVDRLIGSLLDTVSWLRADPSRLTDDLSMEVATSLLVIEQANDAPNADADLLHSQVDVLAARFVSRSHGEVLGELDLSPFGEASQRAQERLFFNQLAREILSNLGQIEQTLDSFFRSPQERDALPSLAGPLKQIEGAFAVLGEQKAVSLVRENADAIARFAVQEEPPTQEEFDQIAHQLSALGFYVDALKTGAARLDDFLNPSSARIDEEIVAAASTTVEAQLKRETRETHDLVAAFKEAPEDESLRKQLVSSLEAIREDAQLVADSGLEQTAKNALASLKSGTVEKEKLTEALAGVAAPATVTPQHSEEAARLLTASNEEVDAELLEIFLEEAHDVLQTIAEHRNKIAAEPHDMESMTTARRGFHTLKGSSRMVGLNMFSDAAKHGEMTMNRWLQLEKDANADLIAMLDLGGQVFGAWVQQLESGGSSAYDAIAFTTLADKLLAELDAPLGGEAPAAVPKPVAAAPVAPVPQPVVEPVIADIVETVPAAGNPSTELDLTSTLMELDLAGFSSGEEMHTEVDLAATDFEGDALHSFTNEFGEAVGDSEAKAQSQRFATPSAATIDTAGGLDFEFDDAEEFGALEDPTATVFVPPVAGEGAFHAATIELPDLELEPPSADLPGSPTPKPEAAAELDLTSSVLNSKFDSGLGDDGIGETELDLTATDLTGLSQHFGEAPQTSGNAAPEVLLADLDLDLEPPKAAPIPSPSPIIDDEDFDDSRFTTTDIAFDEVAEPAADPTEGFGTLMPPLDVSATPPKTRRNDEDEVEVVVIDENEDTAIDLPVINFNMFGNKSVSELPPEDLAANETEVRIGNQTLSKGLYDLYLSESRQLLDKLLEEHTRLASNSDHLPSIDAIRAAHTLAGISGTARVEPAYALGKALEHTLHRFTDTQVPPEPAQTEVLGRAIAALDEMLADVVLQEMPTEAPRLIEELKALQPVLPAPKPLPQPPVTAELVEVAAPVEIPAPSEVPEVATALEEPVVLELPEVLELPPEELPAELPVVAEEPEVVPVVSELPDIELPSLTEEAAEEPEVISLAALAGDTDAALAGVSSLVPEAPQPLEPGVGPRDEIDDQLLDIFFEEAEELINEIGGTLREMRGDSSPEGEPRKALARLLHTLKGSARMAGAMRLGQYIHNIETYLEACTLSQHTGAALVDDLENGLDQVEAVIEQLKNPQAVAAAAAQFEAQEEEEDLSAAADEATGAEPVREPVQVAQQPVAALQQVSDVFEEIEGGNQQRAMLRVRADLVDRFVNEAGEVSIARTRIEGELRVLRRSLLDLTENVIRLRNQLREVEIQAESQMQTRLAAAESQHGDFDPLEFDRFTRLQELTRMMAESVGDVTTIQQNLLRNLDAADSALHAQGRLSRDLQQALMSVRMVPFEEMADRLYRVVRQTAKELGKRANLDIVGGAIEIDRGVLDKMTAPIEHLLRNAIAHGIEMPAERVASGKAEVGQITLKLTQLSNEIAMELSDDGRGLNYQRILERGRANGLISEKEIPNENRLTQLIFEPGFSTAEKVSGVAGRGVGMDVVKNETMAVGGRISVFSEGGKGTRFVVHLPLTLAVTQALLVRCGERTYAIPSNMVEQALELKEAALVEIRAKGMVEWKDTQYPLTYLSRLLGNVDSVPAGGRYQWILLVRGGSQTIAVLIDELRGNQEIVVKNAGPQFVRLQGYSGATVLADGEISLILNPVALAARQIVSVAENGDEQAPEANVPVPETRIPSIMVVDDSLTVRKITSRLLEREGFQVVTAKDGVDALEQLVDYKPDVMLLDIEMPRMDGFDLARNVRADARLRDVPIVMITSRMADKHRNYAMEIGVNHYLGKPYQEEQLLELITGFIAAQRT